MIHLIKTLKIVKKCPNHQKSNEYLYIHLILYMGVAVTEIDYNSKMAFFEKKLKIVEFVTNFSELPSIIQESGKYIYLLHFLICHQFL